MKSKCVVVFPTAIKMARTNKGLYQKEVAEMAKISRKHLALIEEGHKEPGPQLRKKICEVLEIEEEYHVPPRNK
ncbi:MAG: helix-turn-helix transcriptional regulator [Ignavibacteriae bacterium]|nr:helix-turn-helix transcriptional regulator [Ignavibacteriota bacterium]